MSTLGTTSSATGFVGRNPRPGKKSWHTTRRHVFDPVRRKLLQASGELAYDPRRRPWIGETVTTYSDGSPSSVQTTDFVYDGNQIALQFDKDGTGNVTANDLSHRYLNGPAVDQVLADERVTLQNGALATDEVLWTLADAEGTVRDVALLSGTTSVKDHIIYSSFGGVVNESDASQGCLFKFTGCPTDPATDIEFHFQRPRTTGSVDWLKVDQSSYTSGTTNLNDYCGNDPINSTDPSGLDKVVNGASSDADPPWIGPVGYLSQGSGTSYPAGTRDGPIVIAPNGSPYFYNDLVTEANTNDNLSPSQFQAWMAKAEQHYEFCDLMRQLLAVLRNRWAEATNADKKTAYLLMGEVVAKEFFGNAGVVITSDGKRAAEATMDWIVDIAKDVATDHLGGLQVVLKEGETLGKTELVGYIRYYKNGQLVRNVEVGAVRPEWAQNVRQGKRTLPLGEIAAGAAHILDTIEVGEGVRSLIELQNEQNAATALTGNLHALLQIAKALAPVGVSQYLGVLDDSLNLSAFEKAYGDTVAVANAKSLLNDGDFLPLNGPLSKAWFIENCPALAVFFRAAGM